MGFIGGTKESLATSICRVEPLHNYMIFFNGAPMEHDFVLHDISFMCIDDRLYNLVCNINLTIGQLNCGRFYGFKDTSFSLIKKFPLFLKSGQDFNITVNIKSDIHIQALDVSCVLSGIVSRNVC